MILLRAMVVTSLETHVSSSFLLFFTPKKEKICGFASLISMLMNVRNEGSLET